MRPVSLSARSVADAIQLLGSFNFLQKTRLAPLCAAIVFVTALALMAPGLSVADVTAFAYNRLLGRGINLGDALDAPQEGAWGVTLQPAYFRAIRNAGFNSVRVPIRWSAHSQEQPPYTIDPQFFERVDWAINQAISQNLAIVIDVHHFVEMDRDPMSNAPKLLALWRQIADRYSNRLPTLSFELFNEPQDHFTDQRWNAILPQILKVIRVSTPSRILIVGPGYWNSLHHLSDLQLPPDDRRLIITFHYYEPFHFTHQGQTWLPASAVWKGTPWGSSAERGELNRDMREAASWGNRHQRPIYLGEFGSSERADLQSRVRWTKAVVEDAERLHFSWAYWQFCKDFQAFDTNTGTWIKPLLDALVGHS
jgi:endoglucanase